MAIGVDVLSLNDSVLACAGADVMGKVSFKSTTEWWTELVIDDERVDGTREGVALREARPRFELRSLTLRDNEGKRLSSFPARLCADASSDRRRFANRNSVS